MTSLEPRAARIGDRFLAYLLDTAPFGVGAVATAWLAWTRLGRPPTAESAAAILAAWATAATVWQFLGNLAGGTPGKRLLGLRVARADGSRLGAGRALARALAWLLGQSFGSAGFLLALLDPRNRALHDRVAGTVVLESYRKSRAEGGAVFLAAASCAAALFAWQVWSGWARPTPGDLEAVGRARRALDVIARAQDAYKARNGAYAGSLEELATVSGDPDGFRRAADAVFAPDSPRLEAGNARWRASVRARDRRRTKLELEGP